jgi:uncharacterized protein Yka (UPF0111/DUF47 family)
MEELAQYIKSSASEIHLLVTKLKNIKNPAEIIVHCRNISQYEHDADQTYRRAVADLFESGDPIEIIKMKEIYDALEKAADMCVDVADVIEDIVLKYK